MRDNVRDVVLSCVDDMISTSRVTLCCGEARHADVLRSVDESLTLAITRNDFSAVTTVYEVKGEGRRAVRTT